VIDNAESVSYSGIEGSLTVYGGGTGTDLFSVVSSPVGGVVLDGEDGSDTYTVHWGSLVGNVQIIDRGSSGTDKLALECAGTTFGSGTASNSGQTVTFSGIEQPPSPCTVSSASASSAAAAAATTSTSTTTVPFAGSAGASLGTATPAAASSGLVVRLLGAPKAGRVVWALANTTPDAVTYEWQLCKGKSCVTIAAGNAAGIRVRPEWVGKQLRVLVHARADGSRPAAVAAAKTPSLRRR